MSRTVQIAPSVLAADFSRLGEQVATVAAAGADACGSRESAAGAACTDGRRTSLGVARPVGAEAQHLAGVGEDHRVGGDRRGAQRADVRDHEGGHRGQGGGEATTAHGGSTGRAAPGLRPADLRDPRPS